MDKVFAYGSLINSKSRAYSGIYSEATPCEVKGYERVWNVHSDMCYLGVRKNVFRQFNGVIFDVEDVDALDPREGSYRKELCKTSEGESWIFVPKSEVGDALIHQSYLDVVLEGCLQHGLEFYKRFWETTFEWKECEDDRANPKYMRII